MPATHALQSFVEDELLRAPMAMDMALQSVIDSLQRGAATANPGERLVASDLLQRIGTQRARIVDRFVASLREQVDADLNRRRVSDPVATQKSGAALSLVDDDEVTIDVVISHTIEAIKSVAEAELRELLAFTSALAGDMDVGADHNPFRAETQARALWAAAQALPLTRGHQLAFMRHAAMPMAEALRKTYASACSRLENEGVEPAAYRTVIPPAGPRRRRPSFGDLTRQIVQHADAPAEDAPAPRPAQNAASNRQVSVVSTIGKLFAAMLDDKRLPPELHASLSRVEAFALKAALLEPRMLDDHEHPLWVFIDRLAHLATTRPGIDGAERKKLLHFAGKLLDQLGGETQHTPQLYAWAVERLERFAAKQLTERCVAAESEIATMQQLEDRLSRPDATVSTLHGALDVTHLETVPAALLDERPPVDKGGVGDGQRWLAERRAGEWIRLFRRGGWVHSQLLWPGDLGEIWLFADGDSEGTWAIRRSALLLLHTEGLAEVMPVRSLIHDAAERLLHRRSRPSKG